MNTTNQNDFLQPNPMSMATPPKPSPEAVAAVSKILYENTGISWDDKKRCAALLVDEAFAPIIAKAELCDRLAAALKEQTDRINWLSSPARTQAELNSVMCLAGRYFTEEIDKILAALQHHESQNKE